MQYTILINQKKAVEWGLNANESMVFSFILAAASWAEKDADGYWFVAKAKIAAELPLVCSKPASAQRIAKALVAYGLLEKRVIGNRSWYRPTAKGLEWLSATLSGGGSSATPDHQGSPASHPRGGSSATPRGGSSATRSVNQISVNQDQKRVGAPAPRPTVSDREMVAGLYNELLPELPSAFPDRWKASSPTARALSARWKEEPACPNPDFWRAFFREVRRNDTWMRRVPFSDGRYFEGCNLEWLLSPKRFEQVVERALDREQRRSAA